MNKGLIEGEAQYLRNGRSARAKRARTHMHARTHTHTRVPTKYQPTFNGLHDIISQKIEFFINIQVRTSNPTQYAFFKQSQVPTFD
jgi:hypothetical protein